MDLHIENSFKAVTLKTVNPAEETSYKSPGQLIAPPYHMPLYREPAYSPFEFLMRWKQQDDIPFGTTAGVGTILRSFLQYAYSVRNYMNNLFVDSGFNFFEFMSSYSFDVVHEFYWNPCPNFIGKAFFVVFQNFQGLGEQLLGVSGPTLYQHVLNEREKKAIYPSEPGSITLRVPVGSLLGSITSVTPSLGRAFGDGNQLINYPFDDFVLSRFALICASPILTTSPSLNFTISHRIRIENFVPIGPARLNRSDT
jgi:hypothetical protein